MTPAQKNGWGQFAQVAKPVPIPEKPAGRGEATPQPKRRSHKRKTPNRWKAHHDMARKTQKRLTDKEYRVLDVIFDLCDADSNYTTATVSQSALAEYCGCDRRTIIRTVANLEAKGFLVVVVRGGYQRGVSTYRPIPSPNPAHA